MFNLFIFFIDVVGWYITDHLVHGVFPFGSSLKLCWSAV